MWGRVCQTAWQFNLQIDCHKSWSSYSQLQDACPDLWWLCQCQTDSAQKTTQNSRQKFLSSLRQALTLCWSTYTDQVWMLSYLSRFPIRRRWGNLQLSHVELTSRYCCGTNLGLLRISCILVHSARRTLRSITVCLWTRGSLRLRVAHIHFCKWKSSAHTTQGWPLKFLQ